jgi:hypothetical protein
MALALELSRLDPNAQRDHRRGLFMLCPETVRELRCRLERGRHEGLDPEAEVCVGMLFMRRSFERYLDPRAALAACLVDPEDYREERERAFSSPEIQRQVRDVILIAHWLRGHLAEFLPRVPTRGWTPGPALGRFASIESDPWAGLSVDDDMARLTTQVTRRAMGFDCEEDDEEFADEEVDFDPWFSSRGWPSGPRRFAVPVPGATRACCWPCTDTWKRALELIVPCGSPVIAPADGRARCLVTGWGPRAFGLVRIELDEPLVKPDGVYRWMTLGRLGRGRLAADDEPRPVRQGDLLGWSGRGRGLVPYLSVSLKTTNGSRMEPDEIMAEFGWEKAAS